MQVFFLHFSLIFTKFGGGGILNRKEPQFQAELLNSLLHLIEILSFDINPIVSC